MKGLPDGWIKFKAQCILGSNEFMEKIKPALKEKSTLNEIPREQRLAFRPSLEKLLAPGRVKTKEESMGVIQKTCCEYGYTLTEMSRHLD